MDLKKTIEELDLEITRLSQAKTVLASLSDEPKTNVVEMPRRLHWTQRPENKAKLRAVARRRWKAA